jgi:ribosomal protein S18 acetylase RimI-like enzyme
MKIRRYEDTDRAQVIKLWEACGLTVVWNDPNKDINRKLSEHTDLFLVGEVDDEIIACVMGGYDGHRGSVNYLAVSPSYQNKGYGKKMLHKIESCLLDLECPKVNLMVRTSNQEVIRFYERLGYKIDPVVCIGKRLISDE